MMHRFCLAGFILIAFNLPAKAGDPKLKIAEAIFSPPPKTVDIHLRRHMSYSMPSPEQIQAEVARRMEDSEITHRQEHGASAHDPDEVRGLVTLDIVKGYEQMSDRWVDQHWIIGTSGEFKCLTRTLADAKDVSDADTSPTTVYVQPPKGYASALQPKLANADSKLLRLGLPSVAALDDFRLYGSSSHPMMSALQSMIDGTFIPQSGQKTVTPDQASNFMKTLRENLATQMTVEEDVFNGIQVYRVKIANLGVDTTMWLNKEDPSKCYRKEEHKDGDLIKWEEFGDFQPDKNSGGLFPRRAELFEKRPDGRTLNQVTEFISVSLNVTITNADLDWNPPEGWNVLNRKTGELFNVQADGSLILVKSDVVIRDGDSVISSGGINGDNIASQVELVDQRKFGSTRPATEQNQGPVSHPLPLNPTVVQSSKRSWLLLVGLPVALLSSLYVIYSFRRSGSSGFERK